MSPLHSKAEKLRPLVEKLLHAQTVMQAAQDAHKQAADALRKEAEHLDTSRPLVLGGFAVTFADELVMVTPIFDLDEPAAQAVAGGDMDHQPLPGMSDERSSENIVESDKGPAIGGAKKKPTK